MLKNFTNFIGYVDSNKKSVRYYYDSLNYIMRINYRDERRKTRDEGCMPVVLSENGA